MIAPCNECRACGEAWPLPLVGETEWRMHPPALMFGGRAVVERSLKLINHKGAVVKV